MTVREVAERGDAVLSRIEEVIVGKREPLTLILGAILAGGHVLLEDYPGLAKTLAARCFSWTLGLSFRRIQFTPDLLPADIVGTHLYRREEGQFEFRPGPIFAQLILAGSGSATRSLPRRRRSSAAGSPARGRRSRSPR